MAEKTTCAIIGGGPAGMVLGLLLARAGVDVTLLEKHGDFLRDFRGDTVHCSTMRLLDELGLWERFSKLPYSEVRKAAFESNGRSVTYIDFERLRQPHPFIAMVPQWDLLNLLADAATTEPTFTTPIAPAFFSAGSSITEPSSSSQRRRVMHPSMSMTFAAPPSAARIFSGLSSAIAASLVSDIISSAERQHCSAECRLVRHPWPRTHNGG